MRLPSQCLTSGCLLSPRGSCAEGSLTDLDKFIVVLKKQVRLGNLSRGFILLIPHEFWGGEAVGKHDSGTTVLWMSPQIQQVDQEIFNAVRSQGGAHARAR
jgi:hypothetical protein